MEKKFTYCKKSDSNQVFSFKELDLGHNQISFVTKQFTQAIPHIESLNLEDNKLKSLKKETFFPSKKLVKLTLNDNNIKQLPEVRVSIDLIPYFKLHSVTYRLS